MSGINFFGSRLRGDDQLSLHTEIYGQGNDTLVFILGLGGTTRYRAPRLQHVGDSYRVVLVDLLGFGESPTLVALLQRSAPCRGTSRGASFVWTGVVSGSLARCAVDHCLRCQISRSGQKYCCFGYAIFQYPA